MAGDNPRREKKKSAANSLCNFHFLAFIVKIAEQVLVVADTSAVSTLTTIIVLSSGVKERRSKRASAVKYPPPRKSQLNQTKL